MERQDQRRVFGNPQVVTVDDDLLCHQPVNLGDKRPWVDDHAVADDAEFARPHDARRHQRKLIGDAVDNEGMSGVVTALEAHHDIGPLGKPIHNLAFALVAPLGADYNHVCHRSGSHEKAPTSARAKLCIKVLL